MRKIMTSLDLGSSSIKIVVAEITKNNLDVLAFSSVPSKGIKSGLIIEADLVVEQIKKAVKQAEEMLGIPLKKTVVNIPSNYAEFFVSEGSTTITNEEQIVKGMDVVHSLQAAIYNKIMDNREMVSIFPLNYYLNEEEVVKEPLGERANKLLTKVLTVTVPKKNIYSVVGVVEKAGLEVVDVTIGIVGDFYAINQSLNEKIGAIVNIGSDITNIGIFNKGILTNTEILDMGSGNVDRDIAFAFKIKNEDATYLKENLSLAHKRAAQVTSNENIFNNAAETVNINQYELSEVVMYRLKEILEQTKSAINHLTKKEISYIIITGGITEIPDFNIILEEVFGKVASVANIKQIGVRQNGYSTALGMIKYFDNKLKMRDKEYSMFTTEEENELSRITKKINLANDSILGKVFGYFFDN